MNTGEILPFEQIPLKEYAENAYLSFSMYVVLDRALPFVGAASSRYNDASSCDE
jgi:DNA gyrase/topoisomerase IV subunit A